MLQEIVNDELLLVYEMFLQDGARYLPVGINDTVA